MAIVSAAGNSDGKDVEFTLDVTDHQNDSNPVRSGEIKVQSND